MHTLWTGTIGNDDRSNYFDDLHKNIGDSHVLSQCDTNMCTQINSAMCVSCEKQFFKRMMVITSLLYGEIFSHRAGTGLQ